MTTDYDDYYADDWDDLRGEEVVRNSYDPETGEPIDEPCAACEVEESVTTFMSQAVCWPCYRSLASGSHARDTLSFADPGGKSALRASGPGNPRVHPCPNCKSPNVLTPQDVARGYQCDYCANLAENPWAP